MQNKTIIKFFTIIVLCSACCFIFLQLLNASYFLHSKQRIYSDLNIIILSILDLIYILSVLGLLLTCLYLRNKRIIQTVYLIKIINFIGYTTSLLFCFLISLIIFLAKAMDFRGGLSVLSVIELIKKGMAYHATDLITLSIILTIIIGFKRWIKTQLFNAYQAKKNSTGNFGTAFWANEEDLKSYDLYDPSNGILSGIDDKNRRLYLPLLNKLTISPAGGGKTTSSSIPVMLSHEGPAFVFDVKGELWATTARYRSQVLKRKVVVIDPYQVTKGKDFADGKPVELLKEYNLNPFDWIPEDKRQRDRMINSFASSFIINEGGGVKHWDENAKILIRGYIDYMMQALPKESRTLETLYYLLSEPAEQAELTYEQMAQLPGRAAAAANQIGRVGSDERGSILSTSYRQIDWVGDSNVRHTLSESNFDLKEFLTGNMDIFVVVPEDQVTEHSRFVRMIMSLLMSVIVQASPSELPKKKMLFLLEELAQLGYCPDVEQAIEVLRARGVVVWTVFQTLKQITLFQKPDLFKGAPIKQIFTNDDTDTMQWIQMLGGKKTIVTKTISTNSGDSKQKMQLIGGSISKGEGESIQEAGTELIHMNEIREMPRDQQIIFMHGAKPIYCKKSRYFESKEFFGKYDRNPLETRN